MDCKTARLFLHFSRPRADEMEAAEIEDLDAHLVCCSDCADVARTERRVDHQFGRAMRQVEVPEQLRARLLARLAVDRADWYRRWAGHALRALAIAAALMLLVWGGWQWRVNDRPRVDVDAAFLQYGNQRLNNKEEVEARFRGMGVRMHVPENLRFEFLSHCELGQIPGNPGAVVPWLEFVRGQNKADVYVVSPKQFNTEGLQFDPELSRGYPYKLRIERNGGTAYLIFSKSDNLAWFWPGKEAAVAGAN